MSSSDTDVHDISPSLNSSNDFEMLMYTLQFSCSQLKFKCCVSNLTISLQDLEAQKKADPLSEMASTASPSRDLNSLSEDLPVAAPLPSSCILSDTPKPSSGIMMCSTLRFSFQELKRRRQRSLSRLQSSLPGGVKAQRSCRVVTFEVGKVLVHSGFDGIDLYFH